MMLDRMKGTWKEFPRDFWTLTLATFIDRLGGTMIFPFFALYVTQKFDVGMTEAGILFGIFSITGFLGNLVGGALTDKFGRRGIVIFSLVVSALSSLWMGLVNDLYVLYGLAVVVGFLSDIGGPARQAMVADLLPEEKQAEGFGILRVAGNLAWIIGPTIGGLLATQSYMILFVLDAISSLITAGIVYRLIPETKPERVTGEEPESILSSFAGYRHVLADKLFMSFLVVSMFMLLAYLQMYSTLSVYLRDVHGIGPQGFGFLMSMNSTTVVLLQFWFTRKTKKYAPMLMMALGSGLYLIGFTLYGFVEIFLLFAVAMLIITVGEMIVIPVGQALVARFAPEDKRGRYMAIYGLSWTIPSAIGPWAAGIVLDDYDPNLVWYLAGIFCAISVVGFYLLHLRSRDRFTMPIAEGVESAAST